ncbi:MAG: hypothetical protein ATN35_07765 [Epulopiscium sp. Nele67-Bin004]|nr:MAG: hypothetical protein ATN35_07765 [Epulopiscium sp. Nele67-Bin004]
MNNIVPIILLTTTAVSFGSIAYNNPNDVTDVDAINSTDITYVDFISSTSQSESKENQLHDFTTNLLSSSIEEMDKIQVVTPVLNDTNKTVLLTIETTENESLTDEEIQSIIKFVNGSVGEEYEVIISLI